MPTKLIFTCVPRTTADGRAAVSVLVSPRLSGPSYLGDYPELEPSWPEIVRSLSKIAISINGALFPARLSETSASVLDPDLWRRAFPPDTPVRSYTFDPGSLPLRGFPATSIAAHIHELYRDAARNPYTLPQLYPGWGDPTPLDQLVDTVTAVDQYVGSDVWEISDEQLAGTQDRLVQFFRALRFYRRRPPWEPTPPLDLDDEPPIPELDFHDRVALLSDHRTLMRCLGLVFELDLDAGVAPGDLPSTGWIQLELFGTTPSALDLFPRTRYAVDGGRFLAASSGGDVEAGYLKLKSGDFDVLQLDVDGAALQTVELAKNVRRLMTEPSVPPIRETTLPTLRTGGVSIVRNNRTAWLTGRRQRAQVLDSSSIPELWADDLLRGYRIDVNMEGAGWRSLCRRRGRVDVEGTEIEVRDEEGYVKAASGTSHRDAPSPELYLHDAVATWEGWSLCARRPGRTIEFQKHAEQHEQIVQQSNHPGSGPWIVADYHVDGTLPRLRFGRHYQLRARAVDVAGESLPVEDPVATEATDDIVYRRYEAVPPPVLVLPRRITEGESLERLVVRSAPRDDGGQMTTAEYAALPEVAGHGYAATCWRHVLAPKTTLAMAEAHGLLDPAFADLSTATKWYHIARKEAGTLIPTLDDATIVDLETATDVPMEQVELCNPPSTPDDTPAPSWPAQRGDSLKPGQYVIHTGDRVAMPWLPDPMARGVMVWNPVTGLMLPKEYPERSVSWASSEFPLELESIKLLLTGHVDEDEVRVDTAGTTITVSLAPGRMMTLRYSSTLRERLDHMAIWGLLSPSEQSALADSVIQGLHWMLSPPREVTLVHAVQRPVHPPEFIDGPHTSREVGDTVVRFHQQLPTRLYAHGWSTSHVDVRARWRELLDDPKDTMGPRLEDRSADAFRLPVGYGETEVSCMRYADAVTRTLATSPVPHLAESHTEDLRAAEHQLGDTRHRVITYTPVGTTRYQEHFPPAMIADRTRLESAGPAAEVRVPSTARPPKPAVLYAVPSFRWQAIASGRMRSSGVRVYLDRPWFSSGEGERLAVVLYPGATPDDGNTRWPYVSRWGQDPIWSHRTPPPLETARFKNYGETVRLCNDELQWPRMTIGSALLAETSYPVDLVGYVPEWSPARKLWYVDIDLTTYGGHWPFLSLALARWQPESVGALQLSPVVRCHYVQLGPHRAGTVVRTSSGVDVKLTGFTAGNQFEPIGPRNGVDPPAWWYPGLPWNPGSSNAGHRVRVRAEYCPPWIDPAQYDLSWQPVGGTLELNSRYEPTGEVSWSGSLPIDTANVPPNSKLRVVITEAEIYASDEPTATYVPTGWVWNYETEAWEIGQTPARERIVYLDTFGV